MSTASGMEIDIATEVLRSENRQATGLGRTSIPLQTFLMRADNAFDLSGNLTDIGKTRAFVQYMLSGVEERQGRGDYAFDVDMDASRLTDSDGVHTRTYMKNAVAVSNSIPFAQHLKILKCGTLTKRLEEVPAQVKTSWQTPSGKVTEYVRAHLIPNVALASVDGLPDVHILFPGLYDGGRRLPDALTHQHRLELYNKAILPSIVSLKDDGLSQRTLTGRSSAKEFMHIVPPSSIRSFVSTLLTALSMFPWGTGAAFLLRVPGDRIDGSLPTTEEDLFHGVVPEEGRNTIEWIVDAGIELYKPGGVLLWRKKDHEVVLDAFSSMTARKAEHAMRSPSFRSEPVAHVMEACGFEYVTRGKNKVCEVRAYHVERVLESRRCLSFKDVFYINGIPDLEDLDKQYRAAMKSNSEVTARLEVTVMLRSVEILDPLFRKAIKPNFLFNVDAVHYWLWKLYRLFAYKMILNWQKQFALSCRCLPETLTLTLAVISHVNALDVNPGWRGIEDSVLHSAIECDGDICSVENVRLTKIAKKPCEAHSHAKALFIPHNRMVLPSDATFECPRMASSCALEIDVLNGVLHKPLYEIRESLGADVPDVALAVISSVKLPVNCRNRLRRPRVFLSLEEDGVRNRANEVWYSFVTFIASTAVQGKKVSHLCKWTDVDSFGVLYTLQLSKLFDRVQIWNGRSNEWHSQFEFFFPLGKRDWTEKEIAEKPEYIRMWLKLCESMPKREAIELKCCFREEFDNLKWVPMALRDRKTVWTASYQIDAIGLGCDKYVGGKGPVIVLRDGFTFRDVVWNN